MHIYANPARFLKLARPLTAWLGWGGGALIALALLSGLFLTPPDYLQGDSVRIMYVHVPAAWLGMAGWAAIVAASLMQLVWRHRVGDRGSAAAFRGRWSRRLPRHRSLLGRPTWCTYWQWDGRMTSMLVLLFLYIGSIALADATASAAEGRITAISSARRDQPRSSLFGAGGARSIRPGIGIGPVEHRGSISGRAGLGARLLLAVGAIVLIGCARCSRRPGETGCADGCV